MSLEFQRVLTESVPIGAILLAWALLSALATASGSLQFAIQLAGLLMAALFALVRGVALAHEATPAYEDPTVEDVLEENGRAMLAGGPWFVLALVAAFLFRGGFGLGLSLFGRGDLLSRAFGGLVDVFAFTGTITVLLVAIATGTRALRSVRAT